MGILAPAGHGGNLGPVNTTRTAALRAKIRPTKTETEGCGGPTVEGDNAGWADIGRNPKGKGGFPRLLRPSSLKYTRYSSLLTPRTQKNPLLSLLALVGLTGPNGREWWHDAAFTAYAPDISHAIS